MNHVIDVSERRVSRMGHSIENVKQEPRAESGNAAEANVYLSVSGSVGDDREHDELLERILSREIHFKSERQGKIGKGKKLSGKIDMARSNSYEERSQRSLLTGGLGDLKSLCSDPSCQSCAEHHHHRHNCPGCPHSREGNFRRCHNNHHRGCHCYAERHILHRQHLDTKANGHHVGDVVSSPITGHPTDSVNKRQRLELLTSIYEQVKMITQARSGSEPSSLARESCPGQNKLNLPVGLVEPEKTVHSSYVGFQSKPVRSRCGQPVKRRCRRASRRSYPSNDVILPPPPLFDCTSSDDEFTVESAASFMVRHPPLHKRHHRLSSGIEWSKLTKAATKNKTETALEPGVAKPSSLETSKEKINPADANQTTDKPEAAQLKGIDDNATNSTCVLLEESSNVKTGTPDSDVQAIISNNINEVSMTLCPSHETFQLPPASIKDVSQSLDSKLPHHSTGQSGRTGEAQAGGGDVSPRKTPPQMSHVIPTTALGKSNGGGVREAVSRRPQDAREKDLELNELLLSLQILSQSCERGYGSKKIDLAACTRGQQNRKGKSCSPSFSGGSCEHSDLSREYQVKIIDSGSCNNNNNNNHLGSCHNTRCCHLPSHLEGKNSAGHVDIVATTTNEGFTEEDEFKTITAVDKVFKTSLMSAPDKATSASTPIQNTPISKYPGLVVTKHRRYAFSNDRSPNLTTASQQSQTESWTKDSVKELAKETKSEPAPMVLAHPRRKLSSGYDVIDEGGGGGGLKLFEADVLTSLTSTLCDDVKSDILRGRDADVYAPCSIGAHKSTTKKIEIKDDIETIKDSLRAESPKDSLGRTLVQNINSDSTGSNHLALSRNDDGKTKEKKKHGRRFKPSYQRSKSLHREQSQEKNEDGVVDASDLSGSLRELAHLNIDVSQQLVDGKRVFLIKDASPELQVVVNSLTPVLSRRSRSRRSGHYDHAREAVTIGSPPNDPRPVTGTGEKELKVSLSGISYASANGNDLLIHECTTSTFENFSNHNSNPIFKSFNTSFASHHKENQTGRDSNKLKSVWDQCTKDDLDLNSDELSAALEESKNSLFMSPKLSKTWHGVSDFARRRGGPKMGVSVQYQPQWSQKSPPREEKKPTSAQQHSQTLPIISRTLLDALHKRYCAHQYSNNYQTLQPFTMFRIGAGSTAGTQQPITALRIEPCSVRDHEVHVAPPSPQFIARLRQLNKEFKASCSSIQQSPAIQLASPSLQRDADLPPTLPLRASLGAHGLKQGHAAHSLSPQQEITTQTLIRSFPNPNEDKQEVPLHHQESNFLDQPMESSPHAQKVN